MLAHGDLWRRKKENATDYAHRSSARDARCRPEPGQVFVVAAVAPGEETAVGPHGVRGNGEQSTYDEHAERARRLEILERAEASSIRCRSTLRRPACSGGRQPLSSRPAASRADGSRT